MEQIKIENKKIDRLIRILKEDCPDFFKMGDDLKTLITELETLKKDKLLLDKLQLTSQNYGNGWKLRMSTNGRGMRLHETSASTAFKNVRDAIDNYDLETGDEK